MGMDHWIEYRYTDEDGEEEEYELIEWRKQYWINTVISNYIGDDNDGEYEITLQDVIALRNFFQLCIDNPKMMNIVGEKYVPYLYILVKSVNEINDFLGDFENTKLTGKFYYIVSV